MAADENNNNGDGVLISKHAGHHNQLYVLIFTQNMSIKLKLPILNGYNFFALQYSCF